MYELLPHPGVTPDASKEYVAVVATHAINFAVTPYTIVFVSDGTATSAGWVEGGTITYAFEINTGTLCGGCVGYVGGVSTGLTITALKTINAGTTAGSGGIGDSGQTNILGNSGANADAAGVFKGAASSLTSTSIPVDAIFYGASIGGAVPSSGGYVLPVNDHYSGGRLTASSFFALDATSGGSTKCLRVSSGTYQLSTGAFTTARTWAFQTCNPTSQSITLN